MQLGATKSQDEQDIPQHSHLQQYSTIHTKVSEPVSRMEKSTTPTKNKKLLPKRKSSEKSQKSMYSSGHIISIAVKSFKGSNTKRNESLEPV